MDLARFWWSDQAAGPGGNSLRFRGAQHLLRTGAAPVPGGSNTTSFWAKFVNTGRAALFSFGNDYNTGDDGATFDYGGLGGGQPGAIVVYPRNADNGDAIDGRYRDFSAWYHFMYVSEAGVGTRVFVNGEQRFTSATVTPQATDANYTIGATINNVGNPFLFHEGYLAEFHHVEGQALAPATFGELNNGVWRPIDVNIADYGANGFYLDFSDPTNIGADRAPIDGAHTAANNFAANGFELGDNTSVLWDHMTDHPDTNHTLFNPLSTKAMPTPIDAQPDYGLANQRATFDNRATRQIGVTDSGVLTGHWIYEVIVTNVGDNNRTQIGWCASGDQPGYGTQQVSTAEVWWRMDANFRIGVGGAQAYGQPWASGDVIGCRLDLTGNGVIEYFLNGVSQGIAENNLAAVQAFPMGLAPFCGTGNQTSPGASNAVLDFNMGQRPFLFADSYPAGAQPWAAANATAAQIPNGRDQFRALAVNAGTNPLTAAQAVFPSGLWWIKSRVTGDTGTEQHQFVDSVRGGDLTWTCPLGQLEGAFVQPQQNSIAWCWNFNAGNPAANGFDIITYNGDGVAGREIAHNLGQIPSFRITERRTPAGAMAAVVHMGLAGTNTLLLLNSGNAATATGNSQDPANWTDAVTQVGDGTVENAVGSTYVQYVWAPIAGYSNFGTYEPNGDADGPFIYTGFRPAWLLVKKIDDSPNGWWAINDTTRDPVNVSDTTLFANQTDGDQGNNDVDFLSNGFKLRTNFDNWNSQFGGRYIYACFAENPAGGNNVSPAAAR